MCIIAAVTAMIDLTSTDLRKTRGWRIDDPVVRLREWGSERSYGLPDGLTELTLGSGSCCELQLPDAAAKLSRKHAKLMRGPRGWKMRDLDSRNGLWLDGAGGTSSPSRLGSRSGWGPCGSWRRARN